MTHPGPGLIVRGDQGGGQGQATQLGARPEQVRGLAHIGRDGGDGGGAA